MAGINNNDYFSHKLSDNEFKRLATFIHKNIGIKIPNSKKGMVEGRLRKRLLYLELDSFKDYCEYLFSSDGMKSEINQFINVITTNKTDFFREPKHFDFLIEKAIPEFYSANQINAVRQMDIWSSACSTGEEPYTLAMVLSEFIRNHQTIKLDYNILATDISPEVLEKAKKGIYSHEIAIPIPMAYRKQYLLKSKNSNNDLVRIVPELRKKINFRQLNLIGSNYGFKRHVDIIFCRNVMIYFDKQTQDNLLDRLLKYLKVGGYIFMGHSEVLNCHNFPLHAMAPSIYKKV